MFMIDVHDPCELNRAVFRRTALYFKKTRITERFGLIDEESLVMAARLGPGGDDVCVLCAKGEAKDSQGWPCSERRRGSVPWIRGAGGLFQMYAARAHLCAAIGRGPFPR